MSTCIGQADGEGVRAAMPADYSFDLATLHRVKLPGVRNDLGFEVALDEVDLTLPPGNQIAPRCYPLTILVTVKRGNVTLLRPTIDGTVAVFRPDEASGITATDDAAATANEVKLAAGDWVHIDSATHGFRNQGRGNALLHVQAVRPDQSPCGPCFTYPP